MVGDVQAAELQTRTKTLYAFAFGDSHGRTHLYDEQGRPLGQRFLRYPVPFQYVSSGFSRARYHPILHYYRQHVGVDLVARYGTPVKAVADGKVEFASWGGELGRCIKLEHDHGLISIYGHLSRISRAVTDGAYVRVGQVIGWVGTSGLSTGPHLHFGLMKNGVYVNPLTTRLDSMGSEISPRMQGVFEKIKLEYQTVLSRLTQTGGVVTAKAGSEHPASSKAAVCVASAAEVANVSSAQVCADDFSARVRPDDGLTAAKPDGPSLVGAL
jgi:murein DD-endopeptidase MepM/ murein hydrolase activator NlpD